MCRRLANVCVLLLVSSVVCAKSVQPPFYTRILAGSWETSSSASAPFETFRNRAGDAVFYARSQTTSIANIDFLVGTVAILDGQYSSELDAGFLAIGAYYVKKRRAVLVDAQSNLSIAFHSLKPPGVHLSHFTTAMRDQMNREPVHSFIHYSRNRTTAARCPFVMEVEFKYGLPEHGQQPANASGSMVSDKCATSLKVQLSTKAVRLTIERTKWYARVMAVLYSIQLLATVAQMRASWGREKAAAISVIGVSMLLCITLFYSMVHIALSVVMESARPSLTAAASVMQLCTLFYAIWCVKVWAARRPDRSLGAAVSESCFILLAAYIVFGFWVLLLRLLSGLVLLFIFVAYSYFLPQLFFNQVSDVNGPASLHPLYVIITAVSSSFPVLYVLMYPLNFVRIQPHPFLGTVFALYVFGQAAVLVVQHIRQARSAKYSEIDTP